MSNALRTRHVIQPNLFQQHKTERAVGCPITLLLTMSARRRRLGPTEPPHKKLVSPPEFDTCNFYVEAVSPAFDPKRFLQRHLFFIDEDRSIYVSVGLYPTRTTNPSWNLEP